MYIYRERGRDRNQRSAMVGLFLDLSSLPPLTCPLLSEKTSTRKLLVYGLGNHHVPELEMNMYGIFFYNIISYKKCPRPIFRISYIKILTPPTNVFIISYKNNIHSPNMFFNFVEQIITPLKRYSSFFLRISYKIYYTPPTNIYLIIYLFTYLIIL